MGRIEVGPDRVIKLVKSASDLFQAFRVGLVLSLVVLGLHTIYNSNYQSFRVNKGLFNKNDFFAQQQISTHMEHVVQQN